MSLYPELPDFAGFVPAEVTRLVDMRRKVNSSTQRVGKLLPQSVGITELSTATVSTLETNAAASIPYGNVSGEPASPADRQGYVRTDDGDGGASTAFWQYESGAWIRVGPPARHHSQHQPGGSDPMDVDQAVGTGSLRTLGTGAAQAAPGNDTRFSKVTALTANMAAIASQTTLQNLTGLSLTISSSATEQWLMRLRIIVLGANTTMGIKFGFTFPASCTMKGGALQGDGATIGGWQDTSGTPIAMNTQTTTPAFGTFAGTNGIQLEYIVFGGGTGGVIQPQYAQNVSNAGNLQIMAGSCIESRLLVA